MLNHFLIIECDDIDSTSVGIEAQANRFSIFEPTMAKEAYFGCMDNLFYDVEGIFTLHMFLGTFEGCFLVYY